MAIGIEKRVKVRAHEIVIDDCDFFGALPKLVWHEDEPIAHPSSVPLYFVSALARRQVLIANRLSGQHPASQDKPDQCRDCDQNQPGGNRKCRDESE